MSLISFMNPFRVFREYIRTPVEVFIARQYLGYKKKTDEGISSVKELLYRAGVISVFFTAIVWISVFMYVVFYYTYMPNVTHVRPVHLQFKSCDEQMGVCSFPSAHVQLTKRSHMLMAAQPYRIKLILEMPETQINKDLGMFMVCTQMRAKGGVLVSSSCRSAMLRHRMPILDLTPEQMDILLSFVEENPHLAFGRIPINSNSDLQYEYNFKWKEVMRDMNYLDNVPVRGVLEYRAYWNKIKNKVQGKINRARRQLNMSDKPTKLALTDYERRIFNAIPKKSKEKYLMIESIDDKNSSRGNISIKEEFVRPSPEPDINKGVEVVLNGLGDIAESIQNVARVQVELTKGQLEMVKSLNKMAEMFKTLKEEYTKQRQRN